MNNPNAVGARHPRPKSIRKTYPPPMVIEGAADLFVGFWARMARPYGPWNHNYGPWNHNMDFLVLFNPRSLFKKQS